MGKKHRDQDQNQEQGESINLVCVDCGNTFEFTAGEQKFFEERGLYQPKRCPDDRMKKRQQREGR